MAEKSKEIIHDTRIEGKEIQTDSGNKITFNGNYFWTKTSGFIEQLNVYFFGITEMPEKAGFCVAGRKEEMRLFQRVTPMFTR